MEPRVVTLAPAHRHPSAWRRTIGALLRAARDERGLRLVDVAARARLSPQYLSEVERGRKEPSSEVLAALTDALGLTLVDLAHGIAAALDGRDRDRARSRPDRGGTVPRAPGPRATVLDLTSPTTSHDAGHVLLQTGPAGVLGDGARAVTTGPALVAA